MELTKEEKLNVLKNRLGGETKEVYYQPLLGKRGLQLLGHVYEVDGGKLAKYLLDLEERIK